MNPDDLIDEEGIVFASVYGLMRFDAQKVADKLRAGKLTSMEANGLARLLEGSNPQGLKLIIQGQGKGWKPMIEKAASYERILALGAFVEARVAEGETQEAAVFDASDHFGLSESTIRRDLRDYPIALQIERESKGETA